MTNDESFITYPYGFIFGVIDDRETADRLAADLREEGLEADSLLHLHGEEGARRIDASGRGHGLFARIARLLQYTDDSRLHADRYEEEARAGKSVIGIHAPDTATRERMREAFKERGGHFINYYGRQGTTETLEP